MEKEKKEDNYTVFVSDSFVQTDENCKFEPSFRRWLVKEILDDRISINQAIERFNFHPKKGRFLIQNWQKKYSKELFLSLSEMTEQEKQELKAVQEQLKATQKQLEEAIIGNIALNTLIDVAEEKLKIKIRKKPGAKQ